MSKSIEKLANVSLILDRIKKAYKLSSDADLARFLDKSTGTISTWRTRDSMKIADILEFVSEINLNWLFFGDLPVWKKDIRIGGGAAEHTFRIITEEGEIYTPDNIAEKLKTANLPEEEKLQIINQRLQLMDAYIELKQTKKEEESNDEDE